MRERERERERKRFYFNTNTHTQTHTNTHTHTQVDIRKLPEKTKHMNTVDFAQAQSLYFQSRKAGGNHRRRLFELACSRYESGFFLF